MDHLLSPLKRGTKDYLMKTIVPTLVQGLIQMSIQRPADPHLWLSEFLLQKSPQADDYEIKVKSKDAPWAPKAEGEAEAESAAETKVPDEPRSAPRAKTPEKAAEPETASKTAEADSAPARDKGADKDAGAGEGKASEGKGQEGASASPAAPSSPSSKPSPTRSQGSPRKSKSHGMKVSGHFLMITTDLPDDGDGCGVIAAFDARSRRSMELRLSAAQTKALPAAVWDLTAASAEETLAPLRDKLKVEDGPPPRLVFTG